MAALVDGGFFAAEAFFLFFFPVDADALGAAAGGDASGSKSLSKSTPSHSGFGAEDRACTHNPSPSVSHTQQPQTVVQ